MKSARGSLRLSFCEVRLVSPSCNWIPPNRFFSRQTVGGFLHGIFPRWKESTTRKTCSIAFVPSGWTEMMRPFDFCLWEVLGIHFTLPPSGSIFFWFLWGVDWKDVESGCGAWLSQDITQGLNIFDLLVWGESQEMGFTWRSNSIVQNYLPVGHLMIFLLLTILCI